jgi:PAS domain S-box-containing protein
MPAELARSALDAAPDAMLIVDAEGTIHYANRQVFTLFGYAPEEITGEGIEKLIPERFRRRHADHRGDYMAHMRVRPMGQDLELHALRRDLREFPVEVSLSPVVGSEEALVVAAIRDVSERHRTQRELIAARAAAEHAREAADQAREAADRATQSKSRFLATASHDLRQPLQALALLNGALRRTVKDPMVMDALSQQEQAIAAMSRLLNALLDISKLESGAVKPEITDFPVARLLEQMRREFSALAAGKGLALEVEAANACVRSDPSLLEQVLRNLVSNAIKYTHRGRVRVCCSRVTDSLVHLEVRDTGVGIPADHIPCIYDEFYQVGVTGSGPRDGYGLGLSIVRRIVELLDLKIEVSSRVGEGSVFSLLLPAASQAVCQERPDEPASTVRRSVGGQARVLLVEDDPAVRDATAMLLKVEGYQVTAVDSLEQARRAGAAAELDLVLTDYHLGNSETGVQVISALREIRGAPVKSVLITGDTSAAVHELALDPNLRVTSKPINAERLLALLREFLASA